MLEHLQSAQESLEVWRLGLSRLTQEVFSELGIAEDEYAENIEFFGSLDIEPSDYLTWVFDQNGQATMPPTRFTDGSIPVLYTAAESETAFAEKARWLDPLPSASIFQQLLRIDVQGTTKDLRAIDPRPLCLTGEADTGAYEQCFEVTKEAKADALDGFHTPSARNAGGTCTPVLSKAAVSVMELVRYVRFDYSELDARWNAVVL